VKIALDYDNTYSLDPGFWQQFVWLAEVAGHEVRIVTVRDDRYDRTGPLVDVEKILPVIYTRGVAKKAWLTNNGAGDCWMPDIWVDDTPESILTNSPMTQDGLAEWRATREH
jgi:hypothetical protein